MNNNNNNKCKAKEPANGDKVFSKKSSPSEWNDLIGMFQSRELVAYGGPAELAQLSS